MAKAHGTGGVACMAMGHTGHWQGRAGEGWEWEWAADGAKNCEQGRWDMPARNALSINLNQFFIDRPLPSTCPLPAAHPSPDSTPTPAQHFLLCLHHPLRLVPPVHHHTTPVTTHDDTPLAHLAHTAAWRVSHRESAPTFSFIQLLDLQGVSSQGVHHRARLLYHGI